MAIAYEIDTLYQLLGVGYCLAKEDLAKSIPGVLEFEELDSVDLLDVNHGVGVTRNQTYKKQKLESCLHQTYSHFNSGTAKQLKINKKY